MAAHFQLPAAFCWIRCAESDAELNALMMRKEWERLAGEGRFYWPVALALNDSLKELVAHDPAALALFSRSRETRERPAFTDLMWSKGYDLQGKPVELPPGTEIHSRGLPRETRQYALVLHSDQPLTMQDCGSLDSGTLRNGASDTPVGASQSVAAVYVSQDRAPGRIYPIFMRARLEPPYFVTFRRTVKAERARAIR